MFESGSRLKKARWFSTRAWQEGFTQIMMGFSAQTKCAQTQDMTAHATVEERRSDGESLVVVFGGPCVP